jgi:4-hydroxybenzoate polyprenyltransferase
VASGRLDPPAWFLALGVLTWTAGFDILYALQDEAFDRTRGLRSIPARLGKARSLWVSRVFHGGALTAWAIFNALLGCHLFPWLAWLGVALILFREHWILRHGNLDRIDHAFFTLNSLVGPLFFLGHLAEWLLGRA